MPNLTKFELSFRVDTLPVAQPRPRSRVAYINGKPKAVAYDESKHPVQDFKLAVKHECLNRYDGDVMDMAFFVSLEFYFKRPGNKIWKTKSMPREYHIVRPDVDNLAKGVLDVLTGIIWTDDTRVADLRVSKFLGAGTFINGEFQMEKPGCDILIRGLTECR